MKKGWTVLAVDADADNLPAADPNRQRILILEHDAPTRRLLQAALASEPTYDVVVAAHDAEARTAIMENEDFQLILTDLTVAAMSGVHFISQIRALNNDVPILVLSSVQTDQSIAIALQSGADDYLLKPVDLKDLRRTVAQLIDQYWARKSMLAESGAPLQSSTPLPGATSEVRSEGDGTFVELVAPTDAAQAERFQRFAERLLAHTLTEKERLDLRLALEEMVRNAIEWGNRNDASKKLRLSYCLLSDRITFRIEDEGSGFNPDVLVDPSVDPVGHIQRRRASGKRMGGWGVFLARKLMDEVVFSPRGNIVYLTKLLRRTVTPPLAKKLPQPAPDDPSAKKPSE